MSIADAAPTVLHRCIQLGWVPQVADENASLRLQVALLTGQRDDLARELDTVTAMLIAARESLADEQARAGNSARARKSARVTAPPPRLALAWAALWLFVDAVWEQDMERTVRP